MRLAAAFALGCVVAFILAGGGSAPASPSRATAPTTPAGLQSANTPAGAAAAATAWCQLTSEAFISGRWKSAVDSLATGTFRTLALRYQAVAALVHRRLVEARTPFALRVWPLGYRVQRYSSNYARVRVWQLYVLAIAGPIARTEFSTTTVMVQWTAHGWKVTAAPAGADLAPPGREATPGQVATWISTANRLDAYVYVP